MTKEEIEHEKLWTEGIVSAVMLSSKGIVSDFISNLEKVGYKIVKAEPENESLKAEREWISVTPETMPKIPIINNYCVENKDLLVLHYIKFDSYEFGFWNGKKWEMPDTGFAEIWEVDMYMPLPQSPKQSCPQCKTEYTKEELLTNEHCFKCGFEMKGF